MRAFIVLLSVWLVSAHAKASCAQPRAEVIWTYPANGDRDVPTNAVFWVLSSLGATPAASLNDVPLASGDRGELRPGVLLPDHDYTLSLTYPRRDDLDPEVGIKIRFRTGRRKARAPSRLPVPKVTRSKQVPLRLQRLLNAHDCYDTMQSTLVSFHATKQAVVAYLIEGRLWPAEYGAPSIFVRARDAAGLCVELVPIGKGGQPGRKTRACSRGSVSQR